MKSIYFTALLLTTLMMTARSQYQSYPLTHEMTPEEELRKHEIGRDFTPTDPPAPPVRMVAEFEEMQSVLVRFPFGIPINLIAEMSQDCKVKTIVASPAEQQQVLSQYQSNGVNTSNCEWLVAPTNSYWTRDYGPWFVVDGSNEVGISDFPYNRPRPYDDNIPVVLAGQMGIPLYGMNVIHTGGNYMCDGLGIASSTELVWNENPGLTHAEIDTMFRDYLGIRKYHVLPDPLGEYIEHIDCWGKFLDVDKVLIGQVPPTDWRYADFEFVANYFAIQTSSWGTPYQVYRVYTPGDYPYTPYTNSLILNKKVFVPQTGSTWDDEALECYEAAMPGYEVIGVMFNTWENTDALHCRAIGIADVGMLYVNHMPLLGNKNFRLHWDLDADIIPYSGAGLITDSLRCYYRFDGGEFQSTPLQHTTGYHYTATIPFALPGTQVSYYLRAADYTGRRKNHPYIGAPDPHKYTVKYATDILVESDSLIFLTPEEMVEGKSFDIYNFTNGDFVINDIEQEGFNFFHWYIDPWNLTLPYTMAYSDTLNLNVKIDIPLDNILGQLAVDTLDIYSQNGHRQVIIKVDEDLLNSIADRNDHKFCRIEKVSPNPFSESTRISFTLDQAQHAFLGICNVQGQLMAILADEDFAAGSHEVTCNGDKLPDGVYVVKLISDEGTDTERIILVR